MNTFDPVTPSQKVWYKTTAGGIFVAILSLIVLAIVVFVSLFSYYLWKIKFGNPNDLPGVQTSTDQALNSISYVSKSTVNVDLVKYLRPENPVWGSSKAPITILAFMNYECPYTRKNYTTLKQIMQKYESGVRVIFKQVPYPTNLVPATASVCANDQGKFWEFFDGLFQTDEVLNRDYVLALAEKTKLNMTTFTYCLDSGTAAKNVIQNDLKDAGELNVRGTPSYFVNQTKIEGAAETPVWDSAIITTLKDMVSTTKR